MTDADLSKTVAELLARFYRNRLAKLERLQLSQILKKNPYLFRATGVQKASEIVEGILAAFLSSSEETIFGNEFFEPLALRASKAIGGRVADATGVDLVCETETEIKAIAIKSSPNAQNASAQNKQNSEFLSLRSRFQKLGKSYDAIIGCCYGRATGKVQRDKIFRRLAGQAFWEEITGDPNFYVRIIRAMGDLPFQHREEYDAAKAKLTNRLQKHFDLNFVEQDGQIDWEKLVKHNGSKERPPKLLKS